MDLQRTAALVLLAVSGLSRSARAQASGEHSIKRSDLPAPVARAVAAQTRGTLRGLTEEREDGQIFYEAEFLVDGHGRDLLFDSAGALVEVEEAVALSALPAGVRSALEARAGRARITLVESLTKRGRLVAYEAHLVTGGRRSEIQVGPAGEALAHEE
jgi:hypothetical protein